jgi:hypothetical protein
MTTAAIQRDAQAPSLYRQESEISKSDLASIDTEKGLIAHTEEVQVPNTIVEEDEDEGGNVGVAAYEQSKQMAEIVGVVAD